MIAGAVVLVGFPLALWFVAIDAFAPFATVVVLAAFGGGLVALVTRGRQPWLVAAGAVLAVAVGVSAALVQRERERAEASHAIELPSGVSVRATSEAVGDVSYAIGDDEATVYDRTGEEVRRTIDRRDVVGGPNESTVPSTWPGPDFDVHVRPYRAVSVWVTGADGAERWRLDGDDLAAFTIPIAASADGTVALLLCADQRGPADDPLAFGCAVSMREADGRERWRVELDPEVEAGGVLVDGDVPRARWCYGGIVVDDGCGTGRGPLPDSVVIAADDDDDRPARWLDPSDGASTDLGAGALAGPGYVLTWSDESCAVERWSASMTSAETLELPCGDGPIWGASNVGDHVLFRFDDAPRAAAIDAVTGARLDLPAYDVITDSVWLTRGGVRMSSVDADVLVRDGVVVDLTDRLPTDIGEDAMVVTREVESINPFESGTVWEAEVIDLDTGERCGHVRTLIGFRGGPHGTTVLRDQCRALIVSDDGTAVLVGTPPEE